MGAPQSSPSAVRHRADFVLEPGYRDATGDWHCEGTLRAATALDEMRALSDFRVYLRPESFLTVVLARTVERLGTLDAVDAGVIDRLDRADRARLERLYRELNGYPQEEVSPP